MYAVGMLGSYLTQGVYAVAGPFQPFGGAVDIIVVQQEDGTFKSSPWYVKFGDFQGVLKRQEKIVDISVNDIPADFHMILDSRGEAYFEKEVELDEGTCSVLPDGSSSFGSNGQEGEFESVVGTDAKVDAQEAQGSNVSAIFPDMAGFVEMKNAMQEEWSAIQQELDNGVCDELNLDGREGSQLSSERSEAHNREFGLEAACTENGSHCVEVLRMQEDSQEAKEQASSGDGSHPGLRNVRFVSSMNGQKGFEPPQAHNRGEVTNPKDVSISMDVRRTVNSSFEGRRNWEGVSLACQDSVKSDRGSGTNTIVNVEDHGTSIFAMEESTLQKSLTFSNVKVTENYASDSNSCVKNDSLLVEMWTEDTFEGLEDDRSGENNCNADVNGDENEVFASFDCVTVEEGVNDDVPYDCGMNRDSLSWDFESSVHEGLDGDVFPLSESSAILPEEHSGNAVADSEKEEISDCNATGNVGSPGTLATVSSPSKWRLWPFLLRWSRIEKASSLSNQALLAAASVAIRTPVTDSLLQKNGYLKWQQKTKVRTYVPTSVQLASLSLNDGPNKVTFTFSSVLGKTQVDARIYLWKWNTRIVISDVDGTITKSDVLGQVMPLVGRDWSQYGVTRLFSAIKDNGYEVLFLSARAISQAYLTRRFLLNLKQDGEALPEGPMFISPDGLIPSLYREVIRRAPHEFKISCLEGIRELFSTDINPFYAGFGNRETDEISYLKVGIPKGKVFIINPKGEVVVNHRVDCKSYTSLYALVDEMFPPMSSDEQEEFNEWNYWKVPLLDIDDELSASSSKTVKKAGSSKK
ncbi:hypothetical protein GOP47_0019777 [Adiantum capillus-veneris]|nr:hypothetical protein GOP47_0019777 [Adiantum capillus-veneris]